VNACWWEFHHRAGVTEVENMCRWNSTYRFVNQLNEFLVFCDAGKVGLRIVEWVHLGGNELGEARRAANPFIQRVLLVRLSWG